MTCVYITDLKLIYLGYEMENEAFSKPRLHEKLTCYDFKLKKNKAEKTTQMNSR